MYDWVRTEKQRLYNQIPTQHIYRHHSIRVRVYYLVPWVLRLRDHKAELEVKLLYLMAMQANALKELEVFDLLLREENELSRHLWALEYFPRQVDFFDLSFLQVPVIALPEYFAVFSI